MTIVGDMSSIFIIARILGCAAHSSAENDIKTRTRRNVVFVAFSMILYLSSFVLLSIHVIKFETSNLMTAFFVLTRVALIYSCVFTDACLTTLWNRKIRIVLSHLRSFDRITNFDNSSRRGTVRHICRALSFITLMYWTLTGYLSYRYGFQQGVEAIAPLLRGTIYAIIDASLFTQILIFICFSFLIAERFRQLCNILTFSAGEKIILDLHRLDTRFTLQQIWQLHCYLVNATEMLNSVYAVQLLLWISTLSFNSMSRIYTMNVFQLTKDALIRDSTIVFVCGWHLFLITAICHATARQANRVGEIIFSPSSSVSTKGVSLQKNLEVVGYFQLRKVHFFTVAGFVRVDLPLLLSIISGMTTYLVIVC
ncbi:uncharacterized protein LOC117222243 [Megalopta genalis]|uniref:uncharacterized protein LOC117222243 n=1 Tax=Megalopta genalis TaxID=115081 RepID=UPI0014434A2F|nr:uncharacterized protein LOC117222243 [Megalopta genalis]